MLDRIDSPLDPRVADYRAIPDPARLREQGVFVAEGRLVVRRLLGQPRFVTRSLLVNAAALESLRDVLPDAEADPRPVFLASTETLTAVGGFNFHRGCLAIGERPSPSSVEDIVLATPARGPIIVLEGLTQADNVGSVFRNAAAFSAAAVLLDAACCDPLYRKALRTSVGAVLDVPFARLGDPVAELTRLRGHGYRLVALTPAAGASAIDRYVAASAPAAVALLVGSEGAGLSSALLALADDRVRIAMAPGVDSLNVATATGIALHRLMTDR